jgi:hypothetical protein
LLSIGISIALPFRKYSRTAGNKQLPLFQEQAYAGIIREPASGFEKFLITAHCVIRHVIWLLIARPS